MTTQENGTVVDSRIIYKLRKCNPNRPHRCIGTVSNELYEMVEVQETVFIEDGKKIVLYFDVEELEDMDYDNWEEVPYEDDETVMDLNDMDDAEITKKTIEMHDRLVVLLNQLVEATRKS